MKLILCIFLIAGSVMSVMADSFTYGRAKTGYLYTTNRMVTAEYDDCRVWLAVVPDGSTNFLDYSESTNNAFALSATFGTNGDIRMEGNMDSAIIHDADDLTFASVGVDQPWSFSAFFKPKTGWSGAGGLFGKATGTTAGEYYAVWIGGTLFFRLIDDSATARIGCTLAGTPTANIWTHMVLRSDGSENNTGLSIFINAVKQSVTPTSFGSYQGMENKAADLLIGRRHTSGTRFDGDMYEVRFLNNELSAVAITNIYNAVPAKYRNE